MNWRRPYAYLSLDFCEGISLGMPSAPRPSSPALPTRAFLLTISTRGDISQECVAALVKHFKAVTVHAYCVLEHGESGKLHFHAVLLYKLPRLRSKLHENLWDRQVKPFHPDSLGSVAVKFQVCPGNDWYDTYLKKESGVQVVLDTYDREAALEYFPAPAIQEALMAKHQSKGLACPWLEQDTGTWAASTFENTPEGALMYLNHRMYVLKNMVPLADPRKLTEKALMYWKYRNGVISPTERELWLLKQLQDGPTYDVPKPARGPESSAPPSI